MREQDAPARPREWDLVYDKAESICRTVLAERAGQFHKWGDQTHTHEAWIAILEEEVAEVKCKVACDYEIDEIFKEIIQVAAVAIAWADDMVRRGSVVEER